MDLAQLANLGEFIGGVAVLVTLIHLSLQIRHNTRAVASATFHSVQSAANGLTIHVASHDGLLAAIECAMVDPTSLDFRQILRLNLFFRTVFRNYEDFREQNQQGFLKDELWNGKVANIRDQLRDEYVRSWWTQNRHIFGASFREWIDQEMSGVEAGQSSFDPRKNV